MRPYFERQEFKFTPLVKKEQTPESAFGIQIIGSAVLLGADGRVVWRGARLDHKAIRKALGLDSK